MAARNEPTEPGGKPAMSETVTVPTPPATSHARALVYFGHAQNIALAALGGVAIVALWWAATTFLDVPAYILPKPARVWLSLWSGIAVSPTDPLGFYLPLWDTLWPTFAGFLIGSVFALAIGALMAEFKFLRQTTMPYIFALQALPKIAVAPLIINWLGFGVWSKITMAALLAFFPVVVNVYAGILSVESELTDLMRSLSATRREAYRYVMIPGSARFLFAGLNLAIVYALLGTILIEFLSAVSGMGVVITKAESATDTATVFAALVVLALTGIGLNLLTKKIEERVVHWGGRRD
jgi:NitT/TauT family transport system permease protein